MKVTDSTYLVQNLTDLAKSDASNKSTQDFAAMLKKAVNNEDEKRLYQACQDLESVLMSKILQTMRQTIPKSGWLGDSFATDTFESMLFDEYAKLISKSNTLGIADIMYRQLKANMSITPPVQINSEESSD